ncbi:MAG: dihydrofolate reductase family protein, partial [Cellvibrio sp.]
MAKLISLMHISFDGFAAGINGEMDWITMDQEIFAYVSTYISKVGTGVYGIKTFQMMDSYWPGMLENPESGELEIKHAKWYQGANKIVCSRTLNHLDNKQARLITNVETEIKKLKQESEQDLMVFGSPRLTQSLARLDLFDEYVINVNPVLIGGGIRMFEDLPRTRLNLLRETKF